MRAEILSVGTELLLGDILNTNAQFLAQELASLGYSVYYQTVVGDNQLRLRSLVQTAKERSDILVISGGLGPTADDLTKETVADAFGDTLVLDPSEVENLKNFFASLGRTMTENNLKQAMVPRNGKKMPNANGTAPGAFFRQGNKMAFLLPGPPSEMKPMFFDQVRPILESMQDSSIRSLTLRVFGIGESDLENRVFDLLESKNPSAALYAKTGEVHIRITAKAPTADQADVMCAEYADLFRALVGDCIYSDDDKDLETTVVSHLLLQNETLAVGESCTGGMLSQRITSVSGASGVFGFGGCTYSNECKHEVLGVRNATLKRYGAISSQVAAEMAFGAAKKAFADYGVGITGIAGPEGGTKEKPVGLVYVAVSHGKQVFVKKLNLPNRGREYIRTLACQNALDMVRRAALGLPIADAKEFTKSQEADFDRLGKPVKRRGAVTRLLVSFLVITGLVALLLLGIYSARNQNNTGANAVVTPAAQGFRYGTAEYDAAAIQLVQSTHEQNPSVAGFVAFQGSVLEQLVAQVRHEQNRLHTAKEEPGTAGMGIIASNHPAFAPKNNILLAGGLPFSALTQWQNTEKETPSSSFTYYTDRDAKPYLIFAVLLLDEKEITNANYKAVDDFTISPLSFSTHQNFLTFFLGTKTRSLYDFGIDVTQSDSFLTITAANPENPKQVLVVCGRMLRSGEKMEGLPKPIAAGAPLLPASAYKENGTVKPDVQALHTYWMGWYLTRGLDNPSLQLDAGMPKADKMPTLPPAIPEETAQSTPESVSESVSAESESSDSSIPQSDVSSLSESTSVSVSSQPKEEPKETPAPVKANPATLTVTMNGTVVTESTVSILAQMCQRDVPTHEPTAMQAYAITAHTWLRNQQGGGNVAPAVVGVLPSPETTRLVQEVAHLLVSGDEINPAFTPFSPVAANATNTADALWNSGRPYLTSVAAPQDKAADGWRAIYTVPKEEVITRAQELLGVSLAPETDAAKWFSNLAKNEGGYVTTLTIGEEKITGAWFWQNFLLQNNKPLLQSPAFEIEYDGQQFIFTSYGVGHGCGLSLNGANAMAREGQDYQSILEHYYPGAPLMEWR